MLHAGLDLSRKRLDVHVVDEGMMTLEVTGILPDRDGLQSLVRRLEGCGQPVRAAIELMTGARFVHDELERLGWEVEIGCCCALPGPPLAWARGRPNLPLGLRPRIRRFGRPRVAAPAGGFHRRHEERFEEPRHKDAPAALFDHS